MPRKRKLRPSKLVDGVQCEIIHMEADEPLSVELQLNAPEGADFSDLDAIVNDPRPWANRIEEDAIRTMFFYLKGAIRFIQEGTHNDLVGAKIALHNFKLVLESYENLIHGR